jgi:hypothetical protein
MRLRGRSAVPTSERGDGGPTMQQPPLALRTVLATARAGRRARQIARKAGETAADVAVETGKAAVEIAADAAGEIISNL